MKKSADRTKDTANLSFVQDQIFCIIPTGLFHVIIYIWKRVKMKAGIARE